MQKLTASWCAASVALVGAAAITTTSVTATVPTEYNAVAQNIQLTSGIDPFAAWQEVFTTAKDNVTSLWNTFALAPLVSTQQGLVNLIHGDFTSPTAILQAIAQPPLDISQTPPDLWLSNDLIHTVIAALTPQLLPDDFPLSTSTVETLLSFAASSLAGELMAPMGPLISPLVALGNSTVDLFNALFGPDADLTTALQDLINIPADVVGGFLNGATLNLDALLPLIAGQLPEHTDITSLSYTFGGLLSPGDTATDVNGFVTNAAPGSSPGIGGSLWNSLGLNIVQFNIINLDAPGVALGPIGAWLGTQEIIAHAMGWDGTGNPLADLFGTAEASSASLFSDLGNLLGL